MTKTKITVKVLSDSFLQLEWTNAEVKQTTEQRCASCARTAPQANTGGREGANVEAAPEETHQKDQECGSNVNIGLVTLHFNVENGKCDRGDLSMTIPKKMQTKWLKR